MKIVMPYIGGCLSKNGSRITGRGGVRTNCYKPEVKMWMWQLEKKVKDNCTTETVIETMPARMGMKHLTIKLIGRFKDDRAPDLSNLHEILGDAIKVGIGVDDKNFDFVDCGYTIGYDEPELEIEIIF